MPLGSRKRVWSPEDDLRLRRHIESGGSAARASVVFRRSESACRARAAELGLKFPLVRELRARALGQSPEAEA